MVGLGVSAPSCCRCVESCNNLSGVPNSVPKRRSNSLVPALLCWLQARLGPRLTCWQRQQLRCQLHALSPFPPDALLLASLGITRRGIGMLQVKLLSGQHTVHQAAKIPRCNSIKGSRVRSHQPYTGGDKASCVGLAAGECPMRHCQPARGQNSPAVRCQQT